MSFQSREKIQNKTKSPNSFGLRYWFLPFSGRHPQHVGAFRGPVVDEAQAATLIRHTYKAMAYLQDILLIPQGWRIHNSDSMACTVECLLLMWNFQLTPNGQWTIFTSLGSYYFRHAEDSENRRRCVDLSFSSGKAVFNGAGLYTTGNEMNSHPGRRVSWEMLKLMPPRHLQRTKWVPTAK